MGSVKHQASVDKDVLFFFNSLVASKSSTLAGVLSRIHTFVKVSISKFGPSPNTPGITLAIVLTYESQKDFVKADPLYRHSSSTCLQSGCLLVLISVFHT